MPKVSVIVPIFNAEPFIARCASSILCQTLDDLEILFIDDCSPDNSIEILKNTIAKFPERATDVRIIKMTSNGGQAAVRHRGIIEATGDFIIHCDSDDWVDPNLYELMYNEAIRSDADVVICPIRDEYLNNSHTRPSRALPASCNEVVCNWWRESVGMFCWNKLVKRCIYTDHHIMPFIGINMWEDNGLMLRVFYHARRLSQIQGAVYHYNRANANAMTSGYGRKAVDQMIKCASLLADFFDSKPDAARYRNTALTLKYLAKLNLVATRYDWLREFHHLFPESNVAAGWIKLNTFSLKGKIRFLFVKYHLAWLFVTLFKIKATLKL
ncbi:MAG: glycosyltransferase family 2 protein [Muribaculaceae bacterium]